MKICLVIPCFNEEKRLPVKKYEQFLQKKQCDLLFVNDGSKDNTKTVLETISNKYHNAFFLNLEKNKGKAIAVKEGIFHCFTLDNNYDYLGYWDADLATPLEEINRFYDILKKEKIDCIFGSRIQKLGSLIKRHWFRHLLGRIFATLASWMLKLPIYDTQCGAKLFKKDVAKSIFAERFVSYWPFDIELLFRLKKKGYKNLYELPLSKWEDVRGSKLSLFDFIKVPIELIKIWYHYR